MRLRRSARLGKARAREYSRETPHKGPRATPCPRPLQLFVLNSSRRSRRLEFVRQRRIPQGLPIEFVNRVCLEAPSKIYMIMKTKTVSKNR